MEKLIRFIYIVVKKVYIVINFKFLRKWRRTRADVTKDIVNGTIDL